MVLTHSEKTAIILALTGLIKIEDEQTDARTVQLIKLQKEFGISMDDIQYALSKGADFCLTLQQMNEEKKLYLFHLLCLYSLGTDGRFNKEVQQIILSVSRAAHMSDELMQKGLNRFKQFIEKNI